MSDEVIDYSRYRVAEAIAEAYAAGDSVASIAANYFDWLTDVKNEANERYVVEVIIAAHDRKDKYAGVVKHR